jgi:hypothetical protein
MRHDLTPVLCLLFPLFSACGGMSAYGTIPSIDEGDVTETSPSTFDFGHYAMTSLAVDPGASDARDVDGDGDADNQLPEAFRHVDALTTDDFSVAEVDRRLADALDDQLLVVLVEAVQDVDTLSFRTFRGEADGASLRVDGGASALTGRFETQDAYAVGPDRLALPLVIAADKPAVTLPMVQATVDGSLDDQGGYGVISGVIPVAELVDQTIAPLLPPNGYDTDADGTIDLTLDEALDLIERSLNHEDISDVELEGGQRGISAALTFDLDPADF